MHIKQTHISDTRPNLLKEHVSQTHGLTEKINNETPTRGIKHWGLIGYSSVLPRIKFGVSGQDSSPQSPTFHTAKRWQQPCDTTLRRINGVTIRH